MRSWSSNEPFRCHVLPSSRLPPERPDPPARPLMLAPIAPAPMPRSAAGSLVFRIPALVMEQQQHRQQHSLQLQATDNHETAECRSPSNSRKKQCTDSELSPSRTSDDASSGAECAPEVTAAPHTRGGRTRKKNWYYVLQKVRSVYRCMMLLHCVRLSDVEIVSSIVNTGGKRHAASGDQAPRSAQGAGSCRN